MGTWEHIQEVSATAKHQGVELRKSFNAAVRRTHLFIVVEMEG